MGGLWGSYYMIPALLGASSMVCAAGGEEFLVDLPATTQATNDFAMTPGDAQAGWRFNRSGTVDRMSWSWSPHHTWGTPAGGTDGDDYAIRVTLNSGTPPSGLTLGVWYALSSTRSVTLYRGGIGSVSCNLTVSIRDSTTLTVLDTQTYTISSTVENDY